MSSDEITGSRETAHQSSWDWAGSLSNEQSLSIYWTCFVQLSTKERSIWRRSDSRPPDWGESGWLPSLSLSSPVLSSSQCPASTSPAQHGSRCPGGVISFHPGIFNLGKSQFWKNFLTFSLMRSFLVVGHRRTCSYGRPQVASVTRTLRLSSSTGSGRLRGKLRTTRPPDRIFYIFLCTIYHVWYKCTCFSANLPWLSASRDPLNVWNFKTLFMFSHF